jgi:hypothetical protein
MSKELNYCVIEKVENTELIAIGKELLSQSGIPSASWQKFLTTFLQTKGSF